MQSYLINKKIIELNPVSDLTADERNYYIDSGYLPMDGYTSPELPAQSKKITVEELHHNLSKRLSTMVVTGLSPLTEDGVINVTRVSSAGNDITVTGSQIVIEPGWYQFTAHAEITYSGTALNRHEQIYLESNWNGQSNSCDFDFSFPHTETIELCGMIHHSGMNTGTVTLSIRNLPAGVSGVNVTLSRMSIFSIRVNDDA